MPNTITIISSQKIEVQRELAYVDKSPDLSENARTTVVGTGDLIRVNTLKPISYQFQKGTNKVPEPFTFLDPVDRSTKSESLLSWPGVKHLIEAGVFEAFQTEQRIAINVFDEGPDEVAPKSKKPKSLDSISDKIVK